jgi:hypothetical protein
MKRRKNCAGQDIEKKQEEGNKNVDRLGRHARKIGETRKSRGKSRNDRKYSHEDSGLKPNPGHPYPPACSAP